MRDFARRSASVLREEGLVAFARKALEHPLNRARARIAARKLRVLARRVETVDDAVELVFTFEFAGVSVAPWQIRSELAGFLELVEERRPRRVVEIGTADGGTLFLLAWFAADDATLVSVDLPAGRFGGGYGVWRRSLYASFGKPRQRIELVQADSHDARTKRAVERILDHEPVDLLFIDGDHTYEGVAADFEAYAPLVRDGGLVALHDIAPGPEEKVGGVPRFWRELSGSARTHELVHGSSGDGFGIGVVEWGRAPAAVRS